MWEHVGLLKTIVTCITAVEFILGSIRNFLFDLDRRHRSVIILGVFLVTNQAGNGEGCLLLGSLSVCEHWRWTGRDWRCVTAGDHAAM